MLEELNFFISLIWINLNVNNHTQLVTGASDSTGLEANDLWIAQEMVVRRGQRSRRPDFGSEVNKRSSVKRLRLEDHKLQGLSDIDFQDS